MFQKMQKKAPSILCFLLSGLIILSSCKKNESVDFYHRFPDQKWYRYNLLSFELPVSKAGKSWDIYFFIRHTKAYEFNSFDFNMIMNTPSGEERIKEYQVDIKRKDGGFAGNCTPDSCEAIVVLKKGISLEKTGILKIEIENLVPKLDLNGVLGAGIRIKPHF
jgi:gliding motility-associated lipoprotein GldH